MNIYKVTFKEKERESYWDNKPLLIVASNYSNAEDKALNFTGIDGREIVEVKLFGETTRNTDVFQLRDR